MVRYIIVTPITAQLTKKKPKALVTTPITAALKAFNELNFKKIAVLTPYPNEVNFTVFNIIPRLKNKIT